MPASHTHASQLDAIVVGAGFAGLYMLHKLRGQGLSVRVLEAGAGVGGTWYWNRYPGARCDIVSMEYSYQFSDELQQEWNWTERYASQPEILAYLNHVADRFGLRPHIQLESRVRSASFDDTTGRWVIETDTGERFAPRYCIMATGCLSAPNEPAFPGMPDFKGRIFHTGRWPHEPVDFSGRRVAVIGTGSSGVQSIPIIARQAGHLFVFQRTPTYSVPAHNAPLASEEQAAVKKDYAGFRAHNNQQPGAADFRVNMASVFSVSEEQRRQEYEARWASGGLPFLGAFGDLVFDAAAAETAADFIRAKIRETVRNPRIADILSPRNVFGCKRMCVDTGYYETFNRPNVTLVDLGRTPTAAVTSRGLRTQEKEYELDDIVFATGFDAMTGALLRMDIRGHGGVTLAGKWREGPLTYLGLATAGFPNLFLITGPGSPSVLSNMVCSIEQHVEFIADLVTYAADRGAARIEAAADAERNWVAHVNEIADATLFRNCNSWYLGANVPGKRRVFMPYFGFPAYVEKCREIAAAGYGGFVLS